MKKLPILLRISPYIFYVIAAVMGVYQFAVNLGIVWASEGKSFDPTGQDKLEWLSFVVSSQPFALGVSEAAYMAANGAILHVLIAIYDNMRAEA